MRLASFKYTGILAGILFLFVIPIQAQVKIGSAGNPNSNAVLELDGGTSKGLLLPRLTATEITALSTAPDGLIVYNKTDNFLYIRKSAAWQKISDATGGLALPYDVTTASAGLLFRITNTSQGDAIWGRGTSGDGITGVSTSGNGGFFGSTSGNALVTTTGNVGIGTSLPAFQLDINGRARIRSNGELNSAGIWYDKMYTAGLGSFAGTMNDSSFGIYGGGDWKFTFDHINNRLGINQSNPKAPLSFSNGTGNKVDIFYTSDNSRYGIGLQTSLMQFYSGGAGDDIAFGYGSSTAFTERMRIKGNGNVGIGTTNPTLGGLVVDKKAGAVNAIFGSNTTGVAIETDYPGIGLNTYYNNGRKVINTGYGGLLGLDPTTGTFNFFNTAASVTGQGGAATLNTRLTILANGNVGIGTSNPTLGGLVVDKKAGAVNAIFGSNTTGVAIETDYPGIGLNTYYNNGRKVINTGYGGLMGLDPTTGTINLYSTAASVTGQGGAATLNARLTILANGNVGIGNTDPQADLALSNTTGNKIDLFSVSPSSKYGMGVQSGRLQLYTATASDNIVFGYGTSAIFYEKMRIQGNGNVGVGTMTPNSKFQVAGSVSMPYKRVDNANYALTDDDYTVKVFLSNGTGINSTVTLPAAAGRTGRIYVISANIPEVQVNPFDLTESKVTILDANGNNVIDGNNLTLSSPPKNYLANFSSRDVFSNISLNRIFKIKQTSITVQSDGTYWQSIANDFVAFRIDDFYD